MFGMRNDEGQGFHARRARAIRGDESTISIQPEELRRRGGARHGGGKEKLRLRVLRRAALVGEPEPWWGISRSLEARRAA